MLRRMRRHLQTFSVGPVWLVNGEVMLRILMMQFQRTKRWNSNKEEQYANSVVSSLSCSHGKRDVRINEGSMSFARVVMRRGGEPMCYPLRDLVSSFVVSPSRLLSPSWEAEGSCGLQEDDVGTSEENTNTSSVRLHSPTTFCLTPVIPLLPSDLSGKRATGC